MEAAPLYLLLDQGLPRDAADLLRARSVNCAHVAEVGMSDAEDTEILDWAQSRDAVVVTLDADFHAILAVSNKSKPSVIRIRIQGLNGTAISALLGGIIDEYAAELGMGCMITVKQRKTTCRLLSRLG